MRSGFKQIESSMAAMSSEMRSSVTALSTNIAERNKPQWQALVVVLTFCTILSDLAYWPINAATTDLKSAVAIISEKMVTQKETDLRTQRGAEDRARAEASVKEIRDPQVPREELDRVWANYDQRLQDQRRQIDEVKTAQGSVYGQRDIILDLRERLDRVERQRIASPGG